MVKKAFTIVTRGKLIAPWVVRATKRRIYVVAAHRSAEFINSALIGYNLPCNDNTSSLPWRDAAYRLYFSAKSS